MSVKKYIVRRSDLKPSSDNPPTKGDRSDKKFIKIPISLDFNSVDQAEVVNRDFISYELEEAINPIVDYEKARFAPTLKNQAVINSLTINLNFLDNNGDYLQTTNYANIGFSDSDIKFQKNSFKKSFLRMNFYDSDKPTNQNLVSTITLFSRLHPSDLNPLVDDNGVIFIGGGLPKNANQIPVRYHLDNPITKPSGFAEGFYIYHFKSDISSLTKLGAKNNRLYMKATYNNAATGKITNFITTNELLNINELIKKLHVRYLLRKNPTGHFYSLDTTYNNANNITESNTSVKLDLYEIRVE